MPGARLPYSVRFMVGRGGNRHETYTVPEGKRAVVRHFAAAVFPASPHDIYLRIHGISVVLFTQATPGNRTFDVRFTAYERETIMVTIVGTDAGYAVDGFLFDDDDGEPDDGNNVITPLARESLELPQPHAA